MLMVTTTHYKMLTLSLRLSTTDGSSFGADATTGIPQFNIISDSLVELEDRHARPSEAGQIVIIDPTSSVVCCHLFQGLLKCIAVNPNVSAKLGPNGSQQHSTRGSTPHTSRSAPKDIKTFEEPVNMPIEEVAIMSMVFLHGCQRPTLAVLYQDKKEVRHVKTYEIDLKTNDKSETGWIQSELSGARTCIAVPSPIGNFIHPCMICPRYMYIFSIRLAHLTSAVDVYRWPSRHRRVLDFIL